MLVFGLEIIGGGGGKMEIFRRVALFVTLLPLLFVRLIAASDVQVTLLNFL